ncbi:MAG: hypothetical protein L3K19_03105 [Thermoplasmata archaeon]|nr:hypothetical protein [Thermoplasmata archaeon]
MASGPFQTTWITPSGPMHCGGCDMAEIQPGRRALRFLGGPGRLKRLAGTWYHGWGCLAQHAERLMVDEERYGPAVAETYRELEIWARQQDRAAHRMV